MTDLVLEQKPRKSLICSIFRMSQAGVKIANTNMVIAELLADWSGSFALAFGKLYAQRLPNFGFIAAQLEALTQSTGKVPAKA